MKHLIKTAAACALLAGPALAQSPIYGSWPPASDYLNETTLPEAFATISEETGIDWELIAGGQLADGRGTLAAIGDNLMQGGLAIPVYTPNDMPSLALLYSTVVPGDDPVAVAGAAIQTVFQDCPECLEQARDTNVLPLGGFASAAYRLMCTEPVADMADMKGLRIRATGGYSEMAAAANASPMSVTLTEAVSLLQRGGLDCLMAAREWLLTYGYGEYARYVTDLPLGVSAPALGFAMNRDTFLALSPEEQAAHLRASAYITARHTIGNYVERDQQSFERVQEEFGVELVEAGPELTALVETFAETDRDRLIASGKELGVSDPEALLDAYMANVERWREISAEVGTDVDAFADAIWREVFADLDPSTL